MINYKTRGLKRDPTIPKRERLVTRNEPYWRSRSRDLLQTCDNVFHQQMWSRAPTCNDALAWRDSYSATGTYTTGELYRMTDMVIPNYAARSAAGEVFMNPMTATYCQVGAPSGHLHQVTQIASACIGAQSYNQSWKWLSGIKMRDWVGYPYDLTSKVIKLPASVISADEERRLRAEVSTCARAKRGQGGSGILETLAEAEQVLGTPASILNALGKKIFLKGKGFKTLNAIEGMSALDLINSFGVQPLISDLQDFWAGLQAEVGTKRETSRCHGSTQGSSVSSSYVVFDSVTYELRTTLIQALTIRATLLDELEATLMYNTGFSWGALSNLPWELLHYSFVADYFLNIGQWLAGLKVSAALNTLGSCTTLKNEYTRVVDVVGATPGTGWRIDFPAAGTIRDFWRVFTREVGVDSPSLVVRHDFKLGNIGRAADISSLIGQNLRKLFASLPRVR